MIESLEPIKEYAPLLTPFVPTIIDVFIKPKLQKLSKFFKNSGMESTIAIETKFTEYLERSYNKHFYIPILIFQNQQRKLEDIYIPLTVRAEKKDKNYVINTFPQDFLPKYKKVLVRDTAGMGKSTLMKRLFLSCLESERGIPIFIELRKLKGSDSILSFVHKELNPINDELDQDLVLHLIKDGNFIFFLDGYDEISQSEREKVTQNLHDFISKTGNNLFIMTSRPETSLASFPDFMEFDIQPLKLEEAFELLRKYDGAGKLSEEIIGKLKGKTLESVKDFLKNPLLVSLLYKSYEHKPTIPLKKHNFYRQVFDALYESHDLTKEGAYIRDKYCQLDTDSFHTVLRSLGFLTLKYGIEYDKDEILAFLRKAKAQCSTLDFKESKFLDDLLQTVPIFTIESNKYRWSHKSLQDYFAAQFIWLDSNKDKIDILKRMVRSEENQKYSNVLDLYYDMDYKTFRQIIIHDYLTESLSEYEKHISVKAKDKLTKNEIDLIKLLTLHYSSFFIPHREASKIEKASERKILNENIKNFLEEKGFTLNGYNPYLSVGGFDSEIFCVFVNHNYLLDELLKDKMEPIFQKDNIFNRKTVKTHRRKLKEITTFIGLSSSLVISEGTAKIKQILEERMIPIFSSEFLLDINKCKKMKAEIELEIKKEEANNLFDNL